MTSVSGLYFSYLKTPFTYILFQIFMSLLSVPIRKIISKDSVMLMYQMRKILAVINLVLIANSSSPLISQIILYF